MMMFSIGFIAGIAFLITLAFIMSKRADKRLQELNSQLDQLSFWSEQGTKALRGLRSSVSAGSMEDVIKACERFDLAMRRLNDELRKR